MGFGRLGLLVYTLLFLKSPSFLKRSVSSQLIPLDFSDLRVEALYVTVKNRKRAKCKKNVQKTSLKEISPYGSDVAKEDTDGAGATASKYSTSAPEKKETRKYRQYSTFNRFVLLRSKANKRWNNQFHRIDNEAKVVSNCIHFRSFMKFPRKSDRNTLRILALLWRHCGASNFQSHCYAIVFLGSTRSCIIHCRYLAQSS